MVKNAYLDAWKHITSSQESISSYRADVAEKDASVGAFLELSPEKGAALPSSAEHRERGLEGIPFAVKDNIAVRGFSLTCGSVILKDFVSPYTATAVQRLLDEGALPVGKTNLDEFGMGSDTTNSALQITRNPWDKDHVPGGSSGGSAAAVASGMVPFALGSDTGGSVRQPANFCGVYGLKPTYGAVSRYGLTAYASSLETIGVIADSIDMAEVVFDTMSGIDPKDQTSRTLPVLSPHGVSAGKTIGILSGTEGLDDAVRDGYLRAIEQYRDLGWSVVEVSIDSLKYAVPAYYTIAAAEASANLARYTGIRYGHRSLSGTDVESMTRKTREEGFGAEVKLRILLGTYVLRSGFQDQYYVRAQKIRTKIRNDIAQLFDRVNLLLMPVFPTQAYPFGTDALTPFQQKLADRYTITANLAGIPALSVPTSVSHGLPVGIQLLAPDFAEHRLFDAAREYAAWYRPEEAPDRLQLVERSAYNGIV